MTIKSYPGNRDIKLADIVSDPHKIKLYYSGNNKDTIDRYNNENTLLLLPVKNTARGRIQIDFLKSINIESVKENPQVLKKFVADEYTGEEFMTLVTVRKILAEFYQLENCELYVADISHSVTFLPEYNNGLLEIFIQRNSEYFTIPKRYFEEARDIYDWLMNDFVRTKIYPSIQKYIPSAAQYGIEEMRKIYAKNKELYKYKYSESGNIEEIINNESLIKKILNNSLDQQTRLSINKLINNTSQQKQRINVHNIGPIDSIVTNLDIVEEVRAKDNSSDSTLPRLPIDRRKVYTDKKVLIAPQKMDILNNFTLFLGLSSKLLKHHYDFFLLPHTTKIIWAGQRVICIFSEIESGKNIYYDIELFHPLPKTDFYGGDYLTTTIVTQDKIFIPIPLEICQAFEVQDESREFYVRYDLLYSKKHTNAI